MSPPGRLTRYDHDGLVFDVTDSGPLDGPVAVLLHGFPQRATSWELVAPYLHEAGMRTVAPDQRGYSRGARPSGRSAYRMSRLVGDVVALVDALRVGPVHLVGHDWGAAVAWSTSAARPDLVRTLTSVSVPPPAAFVRSLRRPEQLRRSWYMGMFQLPWLPEWLMSQPRYAERNPGRMPEHAFARFWPEMVEDGALGPALNWYRAIPLPDPSLRGGRVRVPTTHVWSDRDVALSRHGADLAHEYVDAPYRLEVLEGVSHWVPDEAPEELARIVRGRAEV